MILDIIMPGVHNARQKLKLTITTGNMTKAEENALIAFPNIVRSNYSDTESGYEQYLYDCIAVSTYRKCYIEGYEQALKDIAHDHA